MRQFRVNYLFVVAGTLMTLAICQTQAAPAPVAAPAPAPANQSTRVAIANTSVIFHNMKEYRALIDKLKARQVDLNTKSQQMQEEIKEMIDKLENAHYNPKNHQYIEGLEAIDGKKSDFQAWQIKTKASVEREQKIVVRDLYLKIEAAVAQVAQQNNIDLVLSDGRRDMDSVEELTPEELQRLLNTRLILYSTKSLDITEMVIAVLDKNFAAAGGPAVAPPAPPAR